MYPEKDIFSTKAVGSMADGVGKNAGKYGEAKGNKCIRPNASEKPNFLSAGKNCRNFSC
jgi:hypothetical protein